MTRDEKIEAAARAICLFLGDDPEATISSFRIAPVNRLGHSYVDARTLVPGWHAYAGMAIAVIDAVIT